MQHKTQNGRRTFLKSAALAGGATVVALGVNAESVQTTASEQNSGVESSKGYHVTPHIEHYYRLARD